MEPEAQMKRVSFWHSIAATLASAQAILVVVLIAISVVATTQFGNVAQLVSVTSDGAEALMRLTHALDLPTMEVAGLTLIKRLALVIDDARITHVFYPVFPPDRNAGDVLAWLKDHPVRSSRD